MKLACRITNIAGRYFVTTLNGGGIHCPMSLPDGFTTEGECRKWLRENYDWEEVK